MVGPLVCNHPHPQDRLRRLMLLAPLASPRNASLVLGPKGRAHIRGAVQPSASTQSRRWPVTSMVVSLWLRSQLVVPQQQPFQIKMLPTLRSQAALNFCAGRTLTAISCGELTERSEF